MQQRLLVTFVLPLFLASCFSGSSSEQSTANFKKIEMQFEEITLTEGETKYFDLELSEATVENLNIKWTILGTDVASRFVFTQGTVAVTKGSFEIPVQIQSQEDAVYNPNIEYTISLEKLSETRQKVFLKDQTFVLLDNDAKPEISFSSSANTALEHDGNTPIYISLDRQAGKSIVVSYELDGSSVADASDYSSSGNQFTVPAGLTSSFFNITLVDDINVEGNEDLVLNITSIKYDDIDLLIHTTDNQHTLTIYDNESTIMPDPASITISEATANSGYARVQLVDISIDEDPTTVKWCVSELQSTMPASGSANCLGGAGTDNGWFSSEPTDFTLSGGDGNKTVYVWVANVFDDVNDGSISADIILDTTPPTLVIGKLPAQTNPATSFPVLMEAVFSEEVTAFDNSDITETGSVLGPEISPIATIDNVSYSISVTKFHSNGSISFSAPIGAAYDLAGNPSTASTDSASPNVDTNIPEGDYQYRSVEKDRDLAIASGSDNGGNFAWIAGWTQVMIFNKPLPDDVGQGDIVVYDGDNNGSRESLVMITKRHAATHFLVQKLNNTNPEDFDYGHKSTNWEIYRAYTSLQNAENGIVNSNIPVSFDGDIAGGKDLVSADESFVFYLYGATNFNSFEVDGWTTDGFHRLRFLAGNGKKFHAINQAHQGVWDDTKVVIESSGPSTVTINDNFVEFHNLQLKNTGGDVFSFGATDTGASLVVVEKSLIESAGSAFVDTLASSWEKYLHIYSSVIKGDICLSPRDSSLYVNSSTLDCTNSSFSGTSSNVNFQNNIVISSASIPAGIVFDPISNYNSFTGTQSSGGANDIVSASIDFIDTNNFNYRLTKNDTSSTNNGIDYSSSLDSRFLFDASEVTRLSNDRGALASNLGASTWVGGGGDNLWSNAANWHGASVPANSEDVVFNYHCPNCNVDMDVAIDQVGFYVGPSHDAVFTQASGTEIEITGEWDMFSGSLNLTDENFILSGSSEVYGASLSLPTDATKKFFINNFFTAGAGVDLVNAGGFLHINSSEDIVIDKVWETPSLSYSVAHTSALHYGSLKTGDLLVESGADFSHSVIQITGDINISGITKGAGLWVINGTGNQAITNSDPSGLLNGLAIDKPSGVLTFNNDSSFSFIRNGYYDYRQGSVDFNSNKQEIKGQCCGYNYVNTGSLEIPDLSLKGANLSLNVEGSIKVLDKLSLNNNYVNAGSLRGGHIELKGDLEIIDKGFNFPIHFTGTQDSVVSKTTPSTGFAHEWVVAKTGGAKVILANDTAWDEGTNPVHIQSGTLDMAGNDFGVLGTLTIDSGATIDTGCGNLSHTTLVNNGTINGGSATPDISVNDVAGPESDNLSFTVNLSNYTCSANVEIDYELQNGTAHTADGDYIEANASLSFAIGETTKTIVVTVNDDDYWEDDETFNLVLSNPTGANIIDSTGLGTIEDDDLADAGFIWTGAGGDSNWSTSANWSGGSAPSFGQIAYFEGTSCTNCDVTIDTDITLDGIRSLSSYVGVITQAAGNTINLNGSGLYLTSGTTFNGSDANIILNNSYFYSSGSFNTTTGTFQTTTADVNIETGTHDFNKGTFYIRNPGPGAVDRSFHIDGVSFNDFTLFWGTDTFFRSSNIVVNGDFIWDGVGGQQVIGLNADLHGDLIAGPSAGNCGGSQSSPTVLSFIGTANQTWSSTNASCEFPSFVINKPSGDMIFSGDLRYNDDFSHISGNVITTGSSVTVSGGSNWSSIDLSGGMEFNDFTVAKTGSGFTIDSNIPIAGTFTYDSNYSNNNGANYKFVAKGDVHLERTPTGNIQPLVIAGSGLQTLSRNQGQFSDLHFNHTGSVQSAQWIIVNQGSVTYTQGTLSPPINLQMKIGNVEKSIDMNGQEINLLSILPLDTYSRLNFLSDINISSELESAANGSYHSTLKGVGEINLKGDLNINSFALWSENSRFINMIGTSPQNITCSSGSCRGPGIKINSSSTVSFPSTFGTNAGIIYQAGTIDLSSTYLNVDWSLSDATLDLGSHPLNLLNLSKDSNFDVTVVGNLVTDALTVSAGTSGMSVNGGEIHVKSSASIEGGNSGSTNVRFIGNEDATLNANYTGDVLGGKIIVQKTAGTLHLDDDVRLNDGEDFEITDGDVRMNSNRLQIGGNLHVAAGSTLYVDCGNLSYNSLSGTGTITSSEATPAISASDLLLEEGESGEVLVSLNLPNCTNTIEVDYTVNSITASLGDNDYSVSPSYAGTLSFAPGEYEKTITITSIEDTIMEDDETLSVDLSNPTNAILSDAQAIVTINNDDTSTFIWVGGVDSNWSTAGNWQGGAVPGTTDVAFFDNSCGINCDVDIDINIDVLGIRANSSYTGSITQLSGNSMTIGSADFRLKGGSFIGGDSLIDLNGDFELDSVSFTSSSGRFEIGYDDGSRRFEGITIVNGANYIHNSGNLVLNSTRSGNSTSGGFPVTGVFTLDGDLELYDFEIDIIDSNASLGYNNLIYVFSDSYKIVVNNLFDFKNGYLAGGSIEVKQNAQMQCVSDSASSDGGTTKLMFTGSSPQEIVKLGAADHTCKLPHLVLNSTSTLSLASGEERLDLYAFSLEAGTFEAPQLLRLQRSDVAGDQDVKIQDHSDIGFSVTGGVFNHNNGLLSLFGTEDVNHIGANIHYFHIPLGLEVYDLEVNLTDSNASWGRDNVGFYIQDAHTLTVLNNMTIIDGVFSRGNIDLRGDFYLEFFNSDVRAEGGWGVIHFSDSSVHNIFASNGTSVPSLKISNNSTVSVDPATTDVNINSLEIASGSTFNASTGELSIGGFSHDLGRLWNHYLGDSLHAHAGSIGLLNYGTFNSSNISLKLNPGQYGSSSTSTQQIYSGNDIVVNDFVVGAYSDYTNNRGTITFNNGTNILVNGDFTLSDGRIVEEVSGGSKVSVVGNVSFTYTDTNVYAMDFYPILEFAGSNTQYFDIQSGSLLSTSIEVNKSSNELVLSSDISLSTSGADLYVNDSSIDLSGFILNIDDELIMDSSSQINQSGGGVNYNTWNGQGSILP